MFPCVAEQYYSRRSGFFNTFSVNKNTTFRILTAVMQCKKYAEFSTDNTSLKTENIANNTGDMFCPLSLTMIYVDSYT